MRTRNEPRSSARDRRAWILSISAIVILIDRLTKYWVSHHIEEGDAIVVIRRVFRITHVRNPGAAFSMFTESTRPEVVRWVLSGFSILAAAVVVFAILRFGRRMTPTMLALALILGGTIGNLWDRLRSGPGNRLSRGPHHPLPLARLQRGRLGHCRRWNSAGAGCSALGPPRRGVLNRQHTFVHSVTALGGPQRLHYRPCWKHRSCPVPNV